MLAYLNLRRHPFHRGVKGCLNGTARVLNLMSTFCGVLVFVLACSFGQRADFLGLIVQIVGVSDLAAGFFVLAILLPIVNWCVANRRAIEDAAETKRPLASLLWWEKSSDGAPARDLGKGQGIVFEGKLLSSQGATLYITLTNVCGTSPQCCCSG